MTGRPPAPAAGPLILASGSPRRRQLLEQIGIEARCVLPEAAERPLAEGEAPQDHVVNEALTKAHSVARRYPQSLVIGADTAVVIGETVLGKPSDEADAARMLRLLSGREHQVYTGLALVRGETEVASDLVTTHVTFRDLCDWEIEAYVTSGEPADKAGAYGIQGRGAILVARVEGCYFNVVGLPLARLWEMLVAARCRPWAAD